LVSDIDRGGAFAHLYGTWALLPESDRALIQGFVLNKFRGDASLLAPAPQMLQDLTGVPVIATVPMIRHHGLPEEDGVFDDSERSNGPVRLTIAIVAYPRISNLDEFQPLLSMPGVRVRWVREPAALAGADWVILPGSKATIADLAWLRRQKLDAAIAQHAAAGGSILGICGGLQMLGEAIVDPFGVESDSVEGNAPGLGLLPLVTAFAAQKTLRHASHCFAAQMGDGAAGPWQALAGVTVRGYEIHHGQTALHPAMLAKGAKVQAVLGGDEPLGWWGGNGQILGVYLHGLFEDVRVLSALFASESEQILSLDQRLDAMAGHMEELFGRERLMQVL
jgi:adenosylcobyric acid synthase